MKEYRIYVGLNDKITHKQKFDESVYLSVLKVICKNYEVGFSVTKIDGGYFHEDASFVSENALQLLFFDVERNTVKEIAKDLCTAFNQEAVIVSEQEIDVELIKGENLDI